MVELDNPIFVLLMESSVTFLRLLLLWETLDSILSIAVGTIKMWY